MKANDIPTILFGNAPFPDPHLALSEPNGLLAIGGTLSPSRLLMAYQSGIFPWYEEGPILWWSPDPRGVLFLNNFHLSKSLKKTLTKKNFEIKVDTDFKAIIEGCAKCRLNKEPGTWINEEMKSAYCKLFNLGYAHSIEVYREQCLIGGLYGVALGRIFFAESMFSDETDGSKIALAYLVNLLSSLKFEFIDCQFYSTHLGSLGITEISRDHFLQKIAENNKLENKIYNWKFIENHH